MGHRGEAPLPPVSSPLRGGGSGGAADGGGCCGTPPKRKPPSPPFGRYSPQEGEKQGEKQNPQDRAPFPPLLGEVAEAEGRGRRGLNRVAPLPAYGGTPPKSDLSRFVSDGLWLCCTRQRRILLVLPGKEAPLCVLIS